MHRVEEIRLAVVLHAWSQDKGQGQRKARDYFSCGGILPPTSFKQFLIIINQLFCFLCCFSLLALGQLVMDSVPMQENKNRNLPLAP